MFFQKKLCFKFAPPKANQVLCLLSEAEMIFVLFQQDDP